LINQWGRRRREQVPSVFLGGGNMGGGKYEVGVGEWELAEAKGRGVGNLWKVREQKGEKRVGIGD